jgi:hypothetical protein
MEGGGEYGREVAAAAYERLAVAAAAYERSAVVEEREREREDGSVWVRGMGRERAGDWSLDLSLRSTRFDNFFGSAVR